MAPLLKFLIPNKKDFKGNLEVFLIFIKKYAIIFIENQRKKKIKIHILTESSFKE
jgi:hypothetical protein